MSTNEVGPVKNPFSGTVHLGVQTSFAPYDISAKVLCGSKTAAAFSKPGADVTCEGCRRKVGLYVPSRAEKDAALIAEGLAAQAAYAAYLAEEARLDAEWDAEHPEEVAARG